MQHSTWISLAAATGVAVAVMAAAYLYQRTMQEQQPQEKHGSSPPPAAADAAVADNTCNLPAQPAPARCSCCRQVPADPKQLQRCSRCKQAWYCSTQCQRMAWPEHRPVCQGAAAAQVQPPAAAIATTSAIAAPPPAATPDETAHTAEAPAGDTGNSTEEASPPQEQQLLPTLQQFLQQHADAREDPLQADFERAVLAFVQGDYAAAVQQLTAVRTAATTAQKQSLAADACRWLGHAHGKRGDAVRALAAFAEGAHVAEGSGNKKLQVDCLCGLASIHRDTGQFSEAAAFLQHALTLCTDLGNISTRATVLCQLGTVLMAQDLQQALAHLRESVRLREEQVVALSQAGERNGLATALYEHAGSMLALGGALYCDRQYSEAADAYQQAYEVFKLADDTDKMVKCLVNLCNVYELQVTSDDHYKHAAEFRQQLFDLVGARTGRPVPASCDLCGAGMSPLQAATSSDQRLLFLACAHCYHFDCWTNKFQHDQGSTCPQCAALD